MRKVTFRQIETFRAVMRSGSMSGGGQALGLTQPGVSRSIRDLEANLKLTLFSRRGNAIRPTAEAEILIREIELQFGGLDKIEDAAAAIRNAERGTVRIQTIMAPMTRLLPFLITEYALRFPQANVTLENSTSRAIIEGVAHRRSDMGLCHVEGEQHGVDIEQLPLMQAVAVIPVDHPLAKLEQVSIEDLGKVPLLSLGVQSTIWRRFTGALQSVGGSPSVVCEATASETLYTLASLGHGIAILEPFTAFNIANDAVVVKKIVPAVEYSVAIIYPKDVSRPRSVDQMAGLIRKAVEVLSHQKFDVDSMRDTLRSRGL